jgi:hypothetical protein
MTSSVKVFSSSKEPVSAGSYLDETISKWISKFPYGIEIKSIHTNSNNYGWMIVIHYVEKR